MIRSVVEIRESSQKHAVRVRPFIVTFDWLKSKKAAEWINTTP